MMDSSKRVAKSQNTFLNLPYRLVVYELLSFHLFACTVLEFDRLELFGRFRFDRFRKIFQVFLSIEPTNGVVFDIGRLFGIFLERGGVDLMLSRDVVNSISQMKNLRSVSLCVSKGRDLVQFLKATNAIDGIQYLKVSCFDVDRRKEPIFTELENLKLWREDSRIISFVIAGPNNITCDLESFFQRIKKTKSLKNLSLIGMEFTNSTNLQTPPLRNLVLGNDVNVKTDPVFKRCTLVACGETPSATNVILLYSKTIKILDLCDMRTFHGRDFCFDNICNLEHLTLDNSEKIDLVSLAKLKRLEVLEIENYVDGQTGASFFDLSVEDNMDKYPFKKLRRLKMSFCLDTIDYRFFKYLRFPSLRELEFCAMSIGLYGGAWNRPTCEGIVDFVCFHEDPSEFDIAELFGDKFRNLECLWLEGYIKNVDGIQECCTRKLSNLTVVSAEVSDVFFQEREMRGLCQLCLDHAPPDSDSVHGRNWKYLPSLQNFTFENDRLCVLHHFELHGFPFNENVHVSFVNTTRSASENIEGVLKDLKKEMKIKNMKKKE